MYRELLLYALICLEKEDWIGMCTYRVASLFICEYKLQNYCCSFAHLCSHDFALPRTIN